VDLWIDGQIVSRREPETCVNLIHRCLVPDTFAYLQLICYDIVVQGDLKALEDLTHEKRREFLAMYSLPTDLPVISFHTEASRAPRAVSTMSHIAHAELPWLPGTTGGEDSSQGTPKLHVAIPLSAAMAICALHLELRYGEKSDGLVTRKDAEVPGSIVVKPDRKLDHAWMVYSPSRKEPNEPDAAQMCEALLTLLLNHERWRRDDITVTPEVEVSLQEAKAISIQVGNNIVAGEASGLLISSPEHLTTEAATSFLEEGTSLTPSTKDLDGESYQDHGSTFSSDMTHCESDMVLREVVSTVVNSQTTAVSDAPSVSSTAGESLQSTTADMP
jgi:hypothetical protein